MPPRAWVLATMLLMPLAAGMAAAPASPWALLIDTSSARPARAFEEFDSRPMRFFDLDGDGDLEIVSQNRNRAVYVLDSRSGAALAELLPTYPPGHPHRPVNGVEVAVLAAGASPSIVVLNSAAVLTVYATSVQGGQLVVAKAWERRLTLCHGDPSADSKPVLADLDRDGDLEILVQTEEVGLYALRHTGQGFWHRCQGGGNAEPAAGDLDGDSSPEVVVGNDAGLLTAHDGRTGAVRWSFPAGGAMPVAPTLAQLDGQPGLEVLVGARDKHDCKEFRNNHAALHALRGNGQHLWTFRDGHGNPLTMTHPVVVDVEPDGRPDIFWMDWNTQGHKCGNWQWMGPAHVYRLSAEGGMAWRATLNVPWSNKDLVVADADGDGQQEVLLNTFGGSDGVAYLNVATGGREKFISVAPNPWRMTREPLVADLWGTGTLQWVIPMQRGSPTFAGAIRVYDTGVPYRALWPGLPAPPTLEAATPLPPDEVVPPPPFAASFRVPGNVNTWWVEARVEANEPLAGVEARTDGGPWQALSPTSWGTWARSSHAPAGGAVEFRATSAAGGQQVSAPFAWMASPAPGASFEPRSLGNAWWVEVKVRGFPAETVEAKVEEGPWRNLLRTSWGTWAASFHVPEGAEVSFRGLGAAGQEALGGPVAWGTS